MKKSIPRSLRLGVAVVVLMFAGIIYAWSNLSAPLSLLGWESSALTFTYTLTVWFFCLGGLVSGFAANRLSPRVRLILSAAMLLAGFWCTSLLQQGSSILLLYLCYGILAGSGIGIVYNTVIAAVSAWFPDKKGFCSGLLLMGFGIGSFLIGLVSAGILQNGSMDWRVLYRILGAASAAAILLGAFVIRPPEQQDRSSLPVTAEQQDLTPRQMLRRSSFWKLFVFFILFSAVGSSALALARPICLSVKLDAAVAAVIAAVASVTNSLGRLTSGAIFDKMGLKTTKFITSGVAIGAPLLSLVGILLDSSVLAAAGLLLCAFSYGFSPTVSAAFTMEFYGKTHYAANLGLINLVLIPGAFVPTLASLLVSSTGGSYLPVFGMLLLFSLVGLVICFTIRDP